MNEIIDASIDKELLLDYEEDGEFHLISATAAFMKRDLKRIVGFCEVVVLSYAINEFRSHFRMTKTTFTVLARELAATGAIPQVQSLGWYSGAGQWSKTIVHSGDGVSDVH